MLIALRIWILLSAGLVCMGWALSALHEFKPFGISWLGLNPLSYLAGFALLAAGGGYWWWKSGWRPLHGPGRSWRVSLRRFRRPAPQIFLVLVILTGLCGSLYAPASYSDANQYRIPRVLHWLAEQQWHWIHTFDTRMNVANCGFEWLSAPMILFTHTDRGCFLLTWFSYLLFPGLLFKFFRLLQVRGRVAWWWMWLLSGSFCYTLQAGTLANDGFAAVYALAAVVFALEAKHRRNVVDLWFSLLAAALTTGVKQTFIPLIVLWFVAALPSFRLLCRRPGGTLWVVGVSLLASALPMIILNLRHDGNWAGVPRHPGLDWEAWKYMDAGSPFWGVIGNGFSLLVLSFAPPVFPMYATWNDWVERLRLTSWGAHFSAFQNFCHLPVAMSEQSAGLGFMVCGMLMLSLGWTWWWRRRHPSAAVRDRFSWQMLALHWLPFGLLLLFMVKLRVHEGVRQLSPYYPFLAVLILLRTGMNPLVRRVWWQRLALLSMFICVPMLLILPFHPLMPLMPLFRHLAERHPGSSTLNRAQNFYSVRELDDRLNVCFEQTLPADEPVIGYATDHQSMEPALWIPFRRRVERVRPDDPDQRSYLDARHIRYVVVDRGFLKVSGWTLEELLDRYDARLIDRVSGKCGWNKLAEPPLAYLVRLNPH